MHAFASELNVVPQSTNGIALDVTSSGPVGATLTVRASSLPAEPQEALPPFGGGLLWALPQGTASVQVIVSGQQWRDVAPGELPDSVMTQVLAEPQPLALVSDVMHLRGIPLVSVAFNALQPNESGDGVRICEQYETQLAYVGGGEMADDRTISASFYDVARGVAANLDDVLPIPVHRPESYLIIAPPTYDAAALTNFVAWKRTRGHDVTVATTDVTGSTAAEIRSYLQTAYDTWDVPPVFVLLVGDVDGTNPLPTWEVPGFYTATIASDHPYTLLDGPDFLPDVFIGRFSVDTQSELQTIVNKCINYESQPFEPEGAWRSRALIVGVRSTDQFYPTYNSSWPTLQWIGRQFLENGYTQLDSVPYPPGNASQITQRVNAGVSFVAYRGFGAPNDWAFPPYTNADVSNLANGAKLPVVMSIVCGGGAFSHETDPCFGELWMRLGTPTTPRGAIGFIGPSELDTKTRWNNTNIAGIFNGIIHENVNTLGAAMLRGKMELVRQFPNNVSNHNADSERSVSFYFKCYNLLGDPGLNFFVGPVRDLETEAPESLPRGTSAIDLAVTEDGSLLPEVWGTVTAGDTVFSRAISEPDGHIALALPQAGVDSVVITLTKPRHEPQRYTVMLASQGVVIDATQTMIVDDGTNGSIGNGDGVPNPGERLALRFVLRNYGSSAYGGGSLSAITQSEWITVVTTSVTIPALAPNAQTPLLTLLVDITSNAPDQATARVTANVDAGLFSWPVPLDITAPLVAIGSISSNGLDENPEPLAISQVDLEFLNNGHADMPAVTATLRSLDTRVVIVDSVAQYASLAIGGSGLPTDDGFEIQIGNLYPGVWSAAELILNGEGFSQSVSYSLPIGNLAATDPTHPDGYGYRMFQNTDTAYTESPVYAWVEIDPTRGGNGALLPLLDQGAGHDSTRTINLPFPFSFYGVSYSQVSICSNGFVSFGETQESYFRNYMLPAIASPDNMVCVFWDDLSMPADGRIYTHHDADGGRFIIEWSHLRNEYGPGAEETFELILFDTECWPTRTGDGDLLMQYQTINNVDDWDNYATVGLQDRDQGYYLLVEYADDVAEGVSLTTQAALYTTGRPENGAYVAYAGNVIDDDSEGGSNGNGDGIAQNAETIELQIQLQNTGTGAASASSGILRESDPYVILLDSVVSFPAIGPGEIVSGSPVRVVIDSLVPNGHSAGFSLPLSGDAFPCVVIPVLIISGPDLELATVVIDDDAIPPSNGNDNDEFNAGETIELFPSATNFGGNDAHGVQAILRRFSTPPLFAILDSTAFLGDIPVETEITASDPFVVQISGTAPDGMIVHLRFILRDNRGIEWQEERDYTVMRPLLAVGGARVADPAPQGNGDGRLVGGETGELYPRVINSGLGAATNVMVTLSTLDTTVELQNTQISMGTVPASSMHESDVPVMISALSGLPEPRNVSITMNITADDGIQVIDVFPVTVGDVPFFDDFENQAPGWAIFGTENLWHLQSREYRSASHAFYCGNETSHEYPDDADAYLRSPIFEYSGTGQLIFSTRYETHSEQDVCRVQLQLGLTTYHLLDSFSGSNVEWHERSYSLAGHEPIEQARIRFWFTSNHNNSAEGWYVDDVILLDEAQPVVSSGNPAIPSVVTLSQNFPNPFNNKTTFEFAIPQGMHVTLALYDVTGRRVATLVNEDKSAGTYKVSWQPLLMSSGLYFVRLDAGDASLVRKALFMK